MPKIFTIADVPDELAQEWLQHLRDFDTKHPGCHFRVAADNETASITEMVDMLLKIEPPLPVRKVYDREMLNMEQMRKSLREFGLNIGPDEEPKK